MLLRVLGAAARRDHLRDGLVLVSHPSDDGPL